MQIRQIRNATIKIHYGGKVFLIDPWLARNVRRKSTGVKRLSASAGEGYSVDN